MVPEYKIRQKLYHHLNPNPSDLNIDVPYEEMTNGTLAYYTVGYFNDPGHVIKYPSKSYAVSIIYAHLLEQYFKIPFDTSLQDPHLLFDNDPYHVPYHDNMETYDIILRMLALRGQLAYYLPQVRATVDYFDLEFFINPNPYFDNANLHK